MASQIGTLSSRSDYVRLQSPRDEPERQLDGSGYRVRQLEESFTQSHTPLLMSTEDSVDDIQEGLSVEEASQRSGFKKRAPRGGTLTRADAAWYVFDNLSCDQAEDLLRQHGQQGTYLVAHFLDPESYGLSIRLVENNNTVYKHYAIGISGREFHVEGLVGNYSSIERVVEAIGEKLSVKLVPIFHSYDHDLSVYSISESAEVPPDYKEAKRYPEAAKKPLPIIVPVYPTLRRMMRTSNSMQRDHVLTSQSGELPEEVTAPENDIHRHRGCCWKTFHTDPDGKWWKPHKAGPCTAILLIIGWILFLVFFGWIVGLALILVAFLIGCAYCINFLCTGRCQVEEEEEEQQNVAPGPAGHAEAGYGPYGRYNQYEGTNNRH